VAKRREAGFPQEPTAPFFPSALGGRYHVPTFTTTFLQVLRRLGLRGPSGQRGPRIHDLRHSFAVSRLMAWHKSGDNLFAKLPTLSTYLGHSTVTGTEVYLHATAELMESVGQRFREHFAVPSARLLCQPPTSQP
jgi:integrase